MLPEVVEQFIQYASPSLFGIDTRQIRPQDPD